MSEQKDALDTVKLTTYLEQHISGFKGPMTAEKFTGGQSNPTYKLTAKSGNYVLRRQPFGSLLKSAHAVDREFRVLNALKETAVPVGKVFYLCEDPEIIGSMFYIMEFCDGHIYWDPALPQIKNNDSRTAMYNKMNQVMVSIHSVDIDACGLADFGKPGNYFERQFNRWSHQYRASQMKSIVAIEQLIIWLEANMPEDDGRVSLVHGDFRLDNLVFAKDRNDIIAVLDWELSTLGHPFADLAYQCMQLRLPNEQKSIQGLGMLDRSAIGIPDEQTYVSLYCQRMGISAIDNWEFYLAFSFFRLAAIAQGVAKRAAEGNASHAQAAQAAAFVEPLAKMALQLL